jgi:hypothetical protein
MNDLKKIAPELSKIKKEVPFRAPENYFSDFPDRLQVIINSNNADNTLPGQRSRPERLIISILKVAASIALLALLLYQPFKRVLPDYLAKGIYEITDTSITEEERIFSMIEKLDENSFVTLLDESNNKETVSSEINDEELLNYLCSNVSEYEIFLQNTY